MSQGRIVQTFPSSLFQVGSVQLGSSAEAKLIALDMISSLAVANSTWRSIAYPLCLSSSFSSSLFRFLCELAWRNMLTIARFLMLALFWQDCGGDRGAADTISDDSKSIINTRCSFVFRNMFSPRTSRCLTSSKTLRR